jgi:hypothetical protein
MATAKSEDYVIDEMIVEDSVGFNSLEKRFIDYVFSWSEFIKRDIFQQIMKWRLKKYID